MNNESALMPFIFSANIACGYHAGNEDIMRRVISLCLHYGVHIGAHPSFADQENFGRTEIRLPAEELYAVVTGQLQVLQKIAMEYDAKLHHVKLHGALYNMAAKDNAVAKVTAAAVKDFDPSLIYYGLSGSVMIAAANKIGLQTFNEVFADRTYQEDGTLTPRSQPNALHTDITAVQQQVIKMIKENKVCTVTGKDIFLQADTICIHGDGVHAVDFAKAIFKILDEK